MPQRAEFVARSKGIKGSVNDARALRTSVWRAARSAVMENIRAAQVDVRPGEMDFHSRGSPAVAGRIDINDRLVVRGVDKPADAVRVDGAGSYIPCTMGRARNGRKIEMVRSMREIVDRVEVCRRRNANPSSP